MSSDWYTKRYTEAVREHDSYLFADRLPCGAIGIFRKTAIGPQIIFALTDTWVETGTPVYWGVEVVLNRLRAHDLWKSGNVFDEIEAEDKREEEAKERALKNSTESFLIDFRKQFARATDGINTSTLAKNDRRRMGDRKHANHQSR